VSASDSGRHSIITRPGSIVASLRCQSSSCRAVVRRVHRCIVIPHSKPESAKRPILLFLVRARGVPIDCRPALPRTGLPTFPT
jgi:hypothetical protein